MVEILLLSHLLRLHAFFFFFSCRGTEFVFCSVTKNKLFFIIQKICYNLMVLCNFGSQCYNFCQLFLVLFKFFFRFRTRQPLMGRNAVSTFRCLIWDRICGIFRWNDILFKFAKGSFSTCVSATIYFQCCATVFYPQIVHLEFQIS